MGSFTTTLESNGTVSITLTLTDYPVWITLQEVDGERGGGPVTATQ